MRPHEFWYTCCMHWYRRRVLRPSDVFNSPLYFRTSRYIRCLSDKQPALRVRTNAARRSRGIIETVLPLIPVSYLFAQPAKMVWITADDKVLSSPFS